MRGVVVRVSPLLLSPLSLVVSPGRAQGGYSFLPPYHKRYGYYRSYGSAGHGAASSATHNYPHGDEPSPGRIHTA